MNAMTKVGRVFLAGAIAVILAGLVVLAVTRCTLSKEPTAPEVQPILAAVPNAPAVRETMPTVDAMDTEGRTPFVVGMYPCPGGTVIVIRFPNAAEIAAVDFTIDALMLEDGDEPFAWTQYGPGEGATWLRIWIDRDGDGTPETVYDYPNGPERDVCAIVGQTL